LLCFLPGEMGGQAAVERTAQFGEIKRLGNQFTDAEAPGGGVVFRTQVAGGHDNRDVRTNPAHGLHEFRARKVGHRDIRDEEIKLAGVLLMGTVRGDLHDIGKNLVCMMAEGAGFEVHDIGVDQSIEKFWAAAEKCNPDIIGMSALLTTTMTYMKTVIDGFKERGRGDIRIAVGGAPVSQMFADEIGADGYGADASSAVDLFVELMKSRGK